MKQIKAVSLFSGCGGADLGATGGFRFLGKNYSRTGIEFIHASDLDKNAVITYNRNFSHHAVNADICDLSFEKGFADLVIGGFPCQAFSTVNPTKEPGKKENQLFWEMARIVEEINPKIFIAENVKGFYRLKNGKYFSLAKSKFESLGYRVYHKLLLAADFGVPQFRERLIMVGVRNDLKQPYEFPRSLFGDFDLSLKPHVPLRAVIKSLIPDDPKYYFSRKAVLGAKNAKPNMKRAVAQDLNRPCLTITSHLAKVSINSRDPVLLVDPKKQIYRRFTPLEAAQIQSFPTSFIFPVSETQAYRQIGNAVPPVLMWHVVQSVVKLISSSKSSKGSSTRKNSSSLTDEAWM